MKIKLLIIVIAIEIKFAILIIVVCILFMCVIILVIMSYFPITILLFGDIIHKLESELSKVTKNLENHYCEMTKFDDKIVIRCLADDNYDLKE